MSFREEKHKEILQFVPIEGNSNAVSWVQMIQLTRSRKVLLYGLKDNWMHYIKIAKVNDDDEEFIVLESLKVAGTS